MNGRIPVVLYQTFLRRMKISCAFWAQEGSSRRTICAVSRVVLFNRFWSLFKQRMYFQKPRMRLQKEKDRTNKHSYKKLKVLNQYYSISIYLHTDCCLFRTEAFPPLGWPDHHQWIGTSWVVVINQSCWNKAYKGQRWDRRTSWASLWLGRAQSHFCGLSARSSVTRRGQQDPGWGSS